MSVAGPLGEGLGEDAHHTTAPAGGHADRRIRPVRARYVLGLAGRRRRRLDGSARGPPVVYRLALPLEGSVRVRLAFTGRRSTSSYQVTILGQKTPDPP